ncbi:MAG: PDZ domain-containing protein [Campylobacterales bacterium]|nr:PDZ domain-containing protein [Campylobacterales bacterium]
MLKKTFILVFLAVSLFSTQKPIENASKVIVNISTKYKAKTDQNPFSFNKYYGNFYNPKYTGISLNELKRKLGSGIVIRANGYILTAFHVIKDTKGLVVTLPGSEEELVAKIVGIDYINDLAILKIEKENLESFFFGDESDVKIGTEVFVAGNPYGNGLFISKGIVSNLVRDNNLNGQVHFIQFNGTIHPATSGGALLDSKGNFIGMINGQFTKEAGLNGFAIATPVKIMRKSVIKLLEKVIKEPVWFGISIGALDKTLKEYYNRNKGVVVVSVEENSPASKAGIQSGDLIISVDDVGVDDVADMNYRIATMRPGDAKLIEYQRGVETYEAIVTLVKPFGTISDGTPGVVLNGLTLEPLTRKLRRNLGIDSDFKGVVITAVSDGSTAKKAGLKKGDIIIRIDGREVKTIDNVKTLMLPQNQRFTVFRKGIVKNLLWIKNE